MFRARPVAFHFDPFPFDLHTIATWAVERLGGYEKNDVPAMERPQVPYTPATLSRIRFSFDPNISLSEDIAPCDLDAIG
jgi:hypothetical protein